MISKKALRIVWCALSLTVVCALAVGQEIKRVSPDTPTVQKLSRPASAKVATNPYPMSRSQRDAILARLSPEQRREVRHLAIDIANQRRLSSIQNNWAALVKELQAESTVVDINGLVQLVLHESYEETRADIEEQAAKVQRYNEMKSRVRSQIEQSRAQQREASQIVTMEAVQSTIGDDAQLANIDLQNQLQKQQQTLQTMSNVSKMLHDTAMAIIRKVG